jgi:hypothetical protein
LDRILGDKGVLRALCRGPKLCTRLGEGAALKGFVRLSRGKYSDPVGRPYRH